MGNKVKKAEYIFKITAEKIRSNQIKTLVSFCMCRCTFRLEGKEFYFAVGHGNVQTSGGRRTG
jgi:hypothetical protein